MYFFHHCQNGFAGRSLETPNVEQRRNNKRIGKPRQRAA